jgi:hypothetical protein
MGIEMSTRYDMKSLAGISAATILLAVSYSHAIQAATDIQNQPTTTPVGTTPVGVGTQTTQTTQTSQTTQGTQGTTGRISNAVLYYTKADEIVIPIGANTVVVQDQFNYIKYIPGDTLRIALPYSGNCPVRFVSLTDSDPFTFRPRGVTGEVSDADGTNTGTVLFFVRFDSLTRAGSRSSGAALLQLDLEVDHDCDDKTPGVPLNIGVTVIATTRK